MNIKLKIVASCIVLLLFAYFLFLAIGNITAETVLSKNQITSRVESLYGGKVEAIIEKDSAYAVSFSTEMATYEVLVDAENGRFSELELIFENPNVAGTDGMTEPNNTPSQPGDKNTNTTTENPNNGEKPNVEKPTTPPTSHKPVILTEQQVIAIAKKQVNGEIEEINYFSTSDGGYYLVEIDGEQDEAVLEIHAVTGKILSVEFED